MPLLKVENIKQKFYRLPSCTRGCPTGLGEATDGSAHKLHVETLFLLSKVFSNLINMAERKKIGLIHKVNDYSFFFSFWSRSWVGQKMASSSGCCMLQYARRRHPSTVSPNFRTHWRSQLGIPKNLKCHIVAIKIIHKIRFIWSEVLINALVKSITCCFIIEDVSLFCLRGVFRKYTRKKFQF